MHPFNFGTAAVFAIAFGLVGDLSWAQSTETEAQVTEPTQKVRITKRDCQRIIRHVASAGVAYKPGVDVRGNPVVPADADGNFTIPLPDVFEFNITKDLTAYLDGPEEQLAADKAAAIAAEKSVAATDAAVSSASLSLAGAQDLYDSAVAGATAAQAAADADPTNTALAAAAVTAQSNLDTATAGLAATQSAYDATKTAATSSDVATALSGAKSTLSAAQEIGYTQDTAAVTASDTATRTAADSTAADSAALSAAETVAKSPDMSLNIGTIRFNINTGEMTFNGQPLTDASNAELAERCRAMMSGN